VFRKIHLQLQLRAPDDLRHQLKRAADGPLARCLDGEMQRPGDRFLDRFSRQIGVNRLGSPQKVVRIDQPRGDERVRQRGLLAAQSVARRPRIRAHAFRTDLQVRPLRAGT
jgi:hypothetical protein